MEKSEILRQSLIKIMDKGLLNKFINTLFDYNLNDNDNIYAQYKVANGNITLNIFDNNDKNCFRGYVFLNKNNKEYIKKEIKDNTSINFVYLKKCQQLYRENHNQNNLILFGAYLTGCDEALDLIFDKDILNIIKNIVTS